MNLGAQMGPVSITKLSPNWACQMGPIHCPKFLLTGKSARNSLSGEQEKLIADFLVTAGDMYMYYRHTDCFRMKLVSLLYQCAKQFIVNFPPRPNLLVMSKVQSPIQDRPPINQPEKFFRVNTSN